MEEICVVPKSVFTTSFLVSKFILLEDEEETEFEKSSTLLPLSWPLLENSTSSLFLLQ